MFMALADAVKGFHLLNRTGSPLYPPLAAALNTFASSWLEFQDGGGQWHQLVDDPTTYLAGSATGFALYSLAIGTQLGVLLPASRYHTAAIKAWGGHAAQVQPNGSVVGSLPDLGSWRTGPTTLGLVVACSGDLVR